MWTNDFGAIVLLMILMKASLGMTESQVWRESLDSLFANESYNSNHRPGIYSDKPLNVFVQLDVNGIVSISAKEMTFSLDVMLTLKWLDPRLPTHVSGDLDLSGKDLDHVWLPDVFFVNQKTATGAVPNRKGRLIETGEIIYTKRMFLTLGCEMDFRSFPMDKQTCLIELESFAHTTDKVVLEWWADAGALTSKKDDKIPEFYIIHAYPKHSTNFRFPGGDYSHLQVEILVGRHIGYYIVQVYVPSLMIVALSWLSFWLDVHAAPARVSLGLLTVVSIITQNAGVNKNLPPVSYTKAMDVWMAVCIVFVCAAMVDFSFANVLARKEKEQKKQKKADPVDTPLVKTSNEDHDVNILDNTSPNEDDQPSTGFCTRIKQNPDYFLDVLCRILFPLVFIIFAIVYFFRYL